MGYKHFIMKILNDLYFIREDIQGERGHEAIEGLIRKIESKSYNSYDLNEADQEYLKKEYKHFIMGILNDLYLIREDVKDNRGHEAIEGLIRKIESKSYDSFEEKDILSVSKTTQNLVQQEYEGKVDVSTTKYQGVYVYKFMK